MKNISFTLTTPQVIARTKDVTRRLGWRALRIGEQLCAVEKGRGLKSGEKIVRLAIIEVVRVSFEALDAIANEDSESPRLS